MATGKRRAAFFTPLELEILMRTYGEFEHIFKRKCNTVAAAKEREKAWENIATRVNECSPVGETRTWQQLKMKYKNIVQTANRKKSDSSKTLTVAEEMALNHRVAEGIPGESSSSESTPKDASAFIKYSDGAICLMEPLHAKIEPVTDEEDESMTGAFIDRDPRHTESTAGQQHGGCSASTAEIDTLPVKDIYKIHLLKKIQKTDKEIQYLDRQIRKADLEIEIMEHKLEEIKKTK